MADVRVPAVEYADADTVPPVESIDDVSPTGYDAYHLEAGIGSVETNGRNEGGDGLVAVALTPSNGGTTDDRRTIDLESGATEIVPFDGPFTREEYDVRTAADG